MPIPTIATGAGTSSEAPSVRAMPHTAVTTLRQ
jgi:hypothetical protein